MVSIVAFKRAIIKLVGEDKDILSHTLGLHVGDITEAAMPLIRLGDLIAEAWASNFANGRVFTVTFNIFSNQASSKQCIEIMDMVESCLLETRDIAEDFIVSKVKVLSAKLDFIKPSRAWKGEVKARFWIETVH